MKCPNCGKKIEPLKFPKIKWVQVKGEELDHVRTVRYSYPLNKWNRHRGVPYVEVVKVNDNGR